MTKDALNLYAIEIAGQTLTPDHIRFEDEGTILLLYRSDAPGSPYPALEAVIEVDE